MCERCNGFSRRDFLKGGALFAGAAFLAACGGPKGVVDELPGADVTYEDHLMSGGEGVGKSGPVKVDTRKIVVPPPRPPEKSDVGEIMPRSAWTNMPLKFRDGVAIEGISRVTIHHSGDGKAFMGESVADVARHLQIVQHAHLDRGMVDIAYHFAIDRAGRAWQLRWLGYEGQHVRKSPKGEPNNPHNVGIVVLGDFNLQSPTKAQTDRLFAMVKLVRAKYGLASSAVYMHGELVGTDCPGKSLKPAIVDARKKGLV